MSHHDDRTDTKVPPPARSNFIRDIVDADLAEGRHTAIVTRFPPEPNGFLHIGHAKAICLNFGIAEQVRGRCNLRFDDTNPLTENESYVSAIERDVAWLGFSWDGTRYASDYFEEMYECAVRLIRKGLAFVDSDTADGIAARRGTISEPGQDSPFRNRSVEENLDLFRRMREGAFPDGAHVLRARIDLAHANLLMRDPILFRIRKAHHYRRGDAWCIYPMYDFAHPLEDAIEGVTHSLCSLEFETHRPLYDWVVRESEMPCRPRQIEFARLNLTYTVLSKRYLLRLVQGKYVMGWDDPRLPTIAGLRRRGVLPESVRRFADLIGVARANSLVDLGKLEFVLRDDLSPQALRVLCVTEPLEVVVTNWPEDRVEWFEAPYWPVDVPREGTRRLPFARRLFIEASDFSDAPPAGWRRLTLGGEVRLRHAYVIRCHDVERDPATGAPVRLLCTADLDTLGAQPKGGKAPGTIHWVAADASIPCEVRVFDRLFSTEQPGSDPEKDFVTELNPRSLVVHDRARIEPAARDWPADARLQFERIGYFWADPTDSRPERPVYNRIVALKDSWAKSQAPEPAPQSRAAKAAAKSTAAAASAAAAATAGTPTPRASEPERAADPRREALLARGVAGEHADVLLGDPAVLAFFETTAGILGDAVLAASWTANEIVREAKTRPLGEIPVTPAGFAALLRLVAAGTISASAGKQVFTQMAARGGDPAELVESLGLRQVSDEASLAPCIDATLAAHADDVARYRAGNQRLLGTFIGKVIAASGGRANPTIVRKLLLERLA